MSQKTSKTLENTKKTSDVIEKFDIINKSGMDEIPPFDNELKQFHSTGSNEEANNPFHSKSLYVGDLAPEVNERLLFEKFNAVGPVSRICLCYDAVTHRSFAHVNFHQIADTKRVLDSMNYIDINGKLYRIMWNQCDPSLRQSGVGKIFVKNMHENIGNKKLFDIFSHFGNILTCKLVTDHETGDSKGYGYVHYETAQVANIVIEKLDGTLIDGQEIQVGASMRRNVRSEQTDWTNCYVKNIPLHWDEDRLCDEFVKYGLVISATIFHGHHKKKKKKKKKISKESEKDDSKKKDKRTSSLDDKAKDMGESEAPAAASTKEITTTVPVEDDLKTESRIGFVSFKLHGCALKAVGALNGKEVETMGKDGKVMMQELYVGRVKTKSERERELCTKFEAEKIDHPNPNHIENLHPKFETQQTDNDMNDNSEAVENGHNLYSSLKTLESKFEEQRLHYKKKFKAQTLKYKKLHDEHDSIKESFFVLLSETNRKEKIDQNQRNNVIRQLQVTYSFMMIDPWSIASILAWVVFLTHLGCFFLVLSFYYLKMFRKGWIKMYMQAKVWPFDLFL